MTHSNSPLFIGGSDPCEKVCAYADAVGAPVGYSCQGGSISYCEQFMPLVKIKNITAIIVAEMTDGSTQTMHVTLDNTKCMPLVSSNVEDIWEDDGPSPNFWENVSITKSHVPNVTITIKGTASADPYMTIQKRDPE